MLDTSMTYDSTDPKNEQLAYHALHPILLAKYIGKYIAIYKGKLIDQDDDQLALVDRLDNSHPNQFVLVRQVQPNPEQEYRRIAIRWETN